MFGRGKRLGENGAMFSFENKDIARLFFDAFSSRLGSFEVSLRDLSVEVESLKISGDQSKLSDLSLLERLQKTEKLLAESLSLISQVRDVILRVPAATSAPQAPAQEWSEHVT